MNENESSGVEQEGSTIVVSADLRGCHTLVSKTRKALERTEPYHIGSLLRTRKSGILNIAVTRDSLHRALRLMQALITAVESRGWKMKPNTDKKCCAIEIGDDELGIRMRERLKRYTVGRRGDESVYAWNEYRYEPTGLFTLEITDYVADATRREWHETKSQKLEEMLPELVEGLAAAAKARIDWHRRLEESKRNWEEAQRRREELERRKQRERHRRDMLLKQSKGYSEAADLRTFIAACRTSTLEGACWSKTSRERWASWAEKIADRLDPFRNGYFEQKLAESEFEAELNC